MSEKSIIVAYLLWFFLGFLGIHRFYLDRPVSGVIWLLTGGLCGIGWCLDLCLIPCMVDSCNNTARGTTTVQYTTTVVQSPPPAHTSYPIQQAPVVYQQPAPQIVYAPPQQDYTAPPPMMNPPPMNPHYNASAPPY